jgi:hypothetical protein
MGERLAALWQQFAKLEARRRFRKLVESRSLKRGPSRELCDLPTPLGFTATGRSAGSPYFLFESGHQPLSPTAAFVSCFVVSSWKGLLRGYEVFSEEQWFSFSGLLRSQAHFIDTINF